MLVCLLKLLLSLFNLILYCYCLKALIITDRSKQRTLVLPGDFDTFAENADQKLQTTFSSVEDSQQKLREEVEAAAKLRREAEVSKLFSLSQLGVEFGSSNGVRIFD